MKILFLEIDTERSWAVASLGPAFIAAAMRRAGHDVALRRVGLDECPDEIATELSQSGAGLIGASLTTRQWLRAREVLRALRRRSKIPVVIGGLHPTFSPDDALREPCIDYVCLGEGEEATLDLVAALEAGRSIGDGDIANIQVSPGKRPSLRPPFEPIDDLPFMARDMLDERHGVVHVTTQRGCPFACTYCAARMYDELYAGTKEHYGRRRSHANVLAELDEIRRSGPLHYVIFLDDTFTIHRPWVREFCSVYGRELHVPFSVHARAETMSRQLVEELAAAGCRHVTYGVESGSERVRREVMKRSVSNERLVEVFRWTREAGILVTANYILGIPGETSAEMQETIDLHAELRPTDFGYFVFYPYPGTHLFRHCQSQGYLPDDYLEREANHRESILDLPDVSKEEIAACYARWTAIRTRDALERQGRAAASPGARADTISEVERSAAIG